MTIEATTWLYVAILKDGPSEQIVGQTDSEQDISFIPAFLDKESAFGKKEEVRSTGHHLRRPCPPCR